MHVYRYSPILECFRHYILTMPHRLLLHNAKQIVQVCTNKERYLTGADTQSIKILEGSETYALVVDSNGMIKDIGTTYDIHERHAGEKFEKEIDLTGKCIIPGLIDGHTHPVWVGDRVHEFSMKLSGASYMDIHKAGGGIYFTVDSVRKATEEELYTSFVARLRSMIKCGTTTLEAKSGYGLDADNEIKMLRVLKRAKEKFSSSVDISITYCGAHAIPKGKTMEEATHDILTNQIPRIDSLVKSKELDVENIDVFYETGVFNRQATVKILRAGKDVGMSINFHGDELNANQSGEVGAEVGARAISHLEEVDEAGIQAMSKQRVVAVLLPTTAYILRLKVPLVRDLIDGGVPVALGSDFNPNAYCYSMPAVMHLACCLLRMTLNEALIGATINAAASIGRSHSHGSLEIGKQADMLVVNAPRWEHLIYRFAAHDDVIDYVIKRGHVVHEKL